MQVPDLVCVVSRRIVCCLPLLLVLTGCPDEKKEERVESLPFTGQNIRIGVPAEMGFRTAWEGPLNEWAAQTGAKYALTELTPGDRSEASTLFDGDDRQTLTIFPLERAPILVATGKLAPIPESLRTADENGVLWSDLFAGLAAKIASRKGTPLIVPLDCPVLVCYYRQDLLNAAGLNPPQTWDEYQQLLERIAAWAPGLVAVEPWSERFRTTMFLARAVSLAQHPGHFSLFFDIETGEPLIDSPGFVRALEAARAAVSRMEPAVLTYDPADCRAALLSGRAALAIGYESPGFDESRDTDSPSVSAHERADGMTIGVARLPGTREIYNPSRRAWEPPAEKGVQRVTLCGFAGWAIAASSASSPRETEASWNALAKVRGRDGVSGFPAGVVGLCRESQLSNPAAIAGTGLAGEEATAYVNAVAQSLRDLQLVAELPAAGRDDFRSALARAITEALSGSQPAEQALQKASRAWHEIIARIGAANVRDSYRVNLGLSPLSPAR
jgi:multiple sugar transport system substrate-binding protein